MLHMLPSNRYNLPQDLQTTFAMRETFEQTTTEWRAHGRHLSDVVIPAVVFVSELLIGRNTQPRCPELQPPYHAPGTLSAFRDEGVVGFLIGTVQAAIAEAGALLGVMVGTVPYAYGAMRGINSDATIPTYAHYGKQAGLLVASGAGIPCVIGLRIVRDLALEAIVAGTHIAGTAAGVLVGESIAIYNVTAQAFGTLRQEA